MAKKTKKVSLAVSVEVEKVCKGGVLALATIEIEGPGRPIVESGPFELRRGRDGRVAMIVPPDNPMAAILADLQAEIGAAIFEACPDL